MATIFRRYYLTTGKDGRKERKAHPKWYIEYRDDQGKPRRVVGFEDRKETEREAFRIEDRVQALRRGLITSFDLHLARPLAEHLEDYRHDLENWGRSPSHVAKTISRITKVAEACRLQTIRDISAARLTQWLADRRAGSIPSTTPPPPPKSDAPRSARTYAEIAKAFGVSPFTVHYWRRLGAPIQPRKESRIDAIAAWRLQRYYETEAGISNCTSNHYLRALKGFVLWLVKGRRLPENVLAGIAQMNTSVDRRKVRRGLSEEELARLLRATEAAPAFRGLAGHERSLLYLTAAYTGLRASELASLTPASFDFSSKPPTVTVLACYSKRRREDHQPLHPSLVRSLRFWIAGKPRALPVWPGTWHKVGSKMLQGDLKLAEIPYADERGREFDFHAFRFHFCSLLARRGIHPKMMQQLARHSDIRVTLDLYTHLEVLDLAKAVDSLPEVPDLETGARGEGATGTEGGAGQEEG